MAQLWLSSSALHTHKGTHQECQQSMYVSQVTQKIGWTLDFGALGLCESNPYYLPHCKQRPWRYSRRKDCWQRNVIRGGGQGLGPDFKGGKEIEKVGMGYLYTCSKGNKQMQNESGKRIYRRGEERLPLLGTNEEWMEDDRVIPQRPWSRHVWWKSINSLKWKVWLK